MISKRLLIIAPYPIAKPEHGGQKRVQAILKEYKKTFETVKFVGIFHKASYPAFDPDDIPLGQKDNLDAADKNPLLLDQIVGRAIANDSHVRSQFARLLMEYQPDVIHVEQVYLYDGLSKLLRDMNLSPILVYSSQNIEYKMKAEIYRSLGLSQKTARRAVSYTKDLEERFSKEAAYVVSVSEVDAARHKKMGAKDVVVAPNGIAAISMPFSKKSHLSKSEQKQKKEKDDGMVDTLVTFIGSGHPPNYLGLLELIGDDTSFLPRSCRLVLGGGVSEYVRHELARDKHPKLWRRLEAAGILSEAELSSLISSTDIFILPILSGGGSNLKTAEAILSGKKIVATSYAFRGFEAYLTLPNIFVADSRDSFRDAILSAISTPYIERSVDEIKLAERVQWDFCLRPMTNRIKKEMRKRFIHDIIAMPYRVARAQISRLWGLAYGR